MSSSVPRPLLPSSANRPRLWPRFLLPDLGEYRHTPTLHRRWESKPKRCTPNLPRAFKGRKSLKEKVVAKIIQLNIPHITVQMRKPGTYVSCSLCSGNVVCQPYCISHILPPVFTIRVHVVLLILFCLFHIHAKQCFILDPPPPLVHEFVLYPDLVFITCHNVF